MTILDLQLSETELISYLNELVNAYENYGFGNFKGTPFVNSSTTSRVINAQMMEVIFEKSDSENYFASTVLNGTVVAKNTISVSGAYMLFSFIVGSDTVMNYIRDVDKSLALKAMKESDTMHFELVNYDTYWKLKVEIK